MEYHLKLFTTISTKFRPIIIALTLWSITSNSLLVYNLYKTVTYYYRFVYAASLQTFYYNVCLRNLPRNGQDEAYGSSSTFILTKSYHSNMRTQTHSRLTAPPGPQSGNNQYGIDIRLRPQHKSM